MQYLIMAFETDDAFAARDDPERADAYWGAWSGYLAALAESGQLAGAAGLQPPGTSSTLRRRDGERLVQDGPFPDTKEHLGGYFLIDVAGLDEALDWADRCPAAAYGAVEVRPVLPPPTGP